MFRRGRTLTRGSLARTLAAGGLAFAVAGAIFGAPALSASSDTPPTPVIVDTDTFGSVDDVGGLAVAFALQQQNKAKVLAIGVAKRADQAAVSADSWKCVGAIAQFYGSPNIPIGTAMPNDGTATADIDFVGPCAAKATAAVPTPESAVTVYRRTLAAQPNNSVVMVSTGYLGNLAALLDSNADAISPLNGRDLIAAKVKLLVSMGGGYPSRAAEHNLAGDVTAAQDVASHWPTKVVWSGYEVGDNVHTGQTIPSTHPVSSPVRAAYAAFGISPGEWYFSYDLTAVYHALQPDDPQLTRSAPGQNTVDGNGGNSFAGTGNQNYLLLGDADALGSTLNALLGTQPGTADTTAPAISSVGADVSGAGATVRWTTDEFADSQVEYGTTTTYGSSTDRDATLATGHAQPLSGLTPGTQYHYRVKSRDAAGNLAVSADGTFWTTGGADSTPPAISNINATAITSASAQISWSTDEASDTQVEYGTTTSYGQSTTVFTTMTQSHSQSVTGLTAGTTYHYRVKSRDASGNLATSDDGTFRTTGTAPGDTTPPQISSVMAGSITATGATISWTTDEAADTQVEYGTTTSYGSSTTLSTAMATSHNQVLSGLASGQLYHYRVKSKDAAGNLATSVDGTFTTTAATTDTTPPVIGSLHEGSVTATSATIFWVTDEAADSQVEYGATTSYGSSTTLDTALVQNHSGQLSGLAPNSLYHYRVKSKDAAGNAATSADATFTTSPASATLTATPSSLTSGQSPVVKWQAVSSPTSHDWIGLYKSGAADTAYYKWFYATTCTTSANSTAASDGECTVLNPPTGAGTYEFRMFRNGSYTKIATSNQFTITVPADTTPPTIGSVAAGSITSTGASITWTTNEGADTLVEYGTTTAYGASTDLNTALVTSHSQTLTGLTAGTLYHYRVKSKDAAGNLATSADGTFTTTAAPSGATLSPSTTTVAAGGSLTLSWASVSPASNLDWVGLYKSGAVDTGFSKWFYTATCTTASGAAKASGSCSVTMPTTAGTYEFRLFKNGGYTRLASSAAVTVGSTPAGASLSAPSSAVSVSPVTVSWQGVSSPTAKDWIGLYAVGSSDMSAIRWVYTSSCTQTAGSTAKASGSCSINTPSTLGNYEFRLFKNDAYTRLATSGQISVGNPPATTSVGVSQVSIAKGGQETVRWSGVNAPTRKDWLGLYKVGAATSSAALKWVFTSSCTQTAGSTASASGSCTFTMPNTVGSYELRLYANDGYTLLAKSPAITVQ